MAWVAMSVPITAVTLFVFFYDVARLWNCWGFKAYELARNVLN